jgi:hypothetical protein
MYRTMILTKQEPTPGYDYNTVQKRETVDTVQGMGSVQNGVGNESCRRGHIVMWPVVVVRAQSAMPSKVPWQHE